jgi:hypothetical protein
MVEGPPRQHPRRGSSQRFDVIGHVAVTAALPTVDLQQPQNEHRNTEHPPHVRNDRLDLRPPRDVHGERPDHAQIVLT